MMYDPSDDSEFLAVFVKRFSRGNVLDIGCGSGILSKIALDCKSVKSVLGVDIDKDSIIYCRKNIIGSRASFRVSDLFSNVREVFDVIISNPPYLPKDSGVEDVALYGGREGQEFSEGLLSIAGRYLSKDGVILLLSSSLSNEESLLKTAYRNLYYYEKLGSLKLGFESLTAWKFSKNELRKILEGRGVKNLKYFSHGKRGIVLTGIFKSKKIAVKLKNPDSSAIGRIENEAKILRVVNKKGIGPKFLFSGEGFLVYEFVEGIYLKDFLKNSGFKEKSFVAKELLKQCKILDSIGVEKGEFSRPLKNAIVTIKKRIVLIDFERSRRVANPKNTRQALQFLVRLGLLSKEKAILKGKLFVVKNQ